ncbi:E3 ubiquitin-protein ligase Topors [Patella vulgata]|uniref:E3 ubiquitin-protein ligase Topors n=1 Tax=Patella vulgata TaxID=6465 RepID=UPI00217FA507|nr:E3 ubiquitin-protein ligase Topors [Patella vulgata]
MADSSTITRSKKKKSSHKSKKKNETPTKELSPLPPPETGNEPPKADTPTRSTNSPDPNCAICLGKLENKSFTDSCFHMFCFVCLLEWSKVKNECPLCKQSFKSIIHNVRSYEDYDQYHLSMYRSNHSPEHPYSRSFRYRTTLTEDRVLNLRSRVIGNPVTDPETVLQLQAIGASPHVLRATDFNARQDWNRRRQASTSDFRRRIYTNGMRLSGVRGTNGRVRDISPAFFTANPALTHRLVPWLNRELNALLFNQESHVQFVLELIMGLIKRFEINSEDFYQHISPFIGRHTRHFVHEFQMFAMSPYCMTIHDKKAIYQQQTESVSSDTDTVNSISDEDSDVQIVSTEAAPSVPSREFLNLPDISAEVQVRSSNFSFWGGPSYLSTSSWHSPTPGPSWQFEQIPPPQPVRNFIPALGRSVGLTETEIDSSSDSASSAGSAIVFVAYDKPWEERSPISLSTDSESEVLIANKTSKKKESKSKKQKSKKSHRTKDKSSEATSVAATDTPADQQTEKPVETPADASERPSEEPSTSLGNSDVHRKKSKHKSKSYRDSHYSKRINILFHRRSTSPEISDSGRKKETVSYSSELVNSPHSSLSSKRKHHDHKSANLADDGEAHHNISSSASRSRSPENNKKHKKKSRKESRSPSVEIISVHHKDKSKKKHKKHKHKHKSSHKHHNKTVASTVVVAEPTDIIRSEKTTPETSSQNSSTCATTSSEASLSTRSFTDALSGICDTLTPVEIATSIAKKTTGIEGSLVSTTDEVLDLTSVNPEELDDDILDVVSTIDAAGSIEATNLSLQSLEEQNGAMSFKKHPSGHKRSHTRRISETNTSLSLPLPDVMMHGDPLFSHGAGSVLYSNVLESFQCAFSGYNPHAWYRQPPHYTSALSNNKPLNLGLRPSSTTQSNPLNLANTILDRDSVPLDLTQVQQADSTKPNNMDLTLSSSGNEETDTEIVSPVLDVVSFDKEGTGNLPQSSTAEKRGSPPDDAVINVIDLSPTEIQSSDSEQMVHSSHDTINSSKSETDNVIELDLSKKSNDYDDSDAETDIYRLDNSQSDIDVNILSDQQISDEDPEIRSSTSMLNCNSINAQSSPEVHISDKKDDILLAKCPVLKKNGVKTDTDMLEINMKRITNNYNHFDNNLRTNNVVNNVTYSKTTTTINSNSKPSSTSAFKDCNLALPIYLEYPNVTSSLHHVKKPNDYGFIGSSLNLKPFAKQLQDSNVYSNGVSDSCDLKISTETQKLDKVTPSKLLKCTGDSSSDIKLLSNDLRLGETKPVSSELQSRDYKSMGSELQTSQYESISSSFRSASNAFYSSDLNASNFKTQSELKFSDHKSSKRELHSNDIKKTSELQSYNGDQPSTSQLQTNSNEFNPSVLTNESESTSYESDILTNTANNFKNSYNTQFCDVSKSLINTTELSNTDSVTPSNDTPASKFPIFWKKKATSLVDSSWREDVSAEESTESESESNIDDSDEIDPVD